MNIPLWVLATPALFLGSAALAQDKPITITFMARPVAVTSGTFGHAFFCLSVPLQAGVKEDCFGFYPNNLTKAFDGPGKVASDLRRSAITGVTTSLRHEISEDARAEVYKTIEKWAGKDYKLVLNNCGDFLYDIAKSAGLSLPPRGSVSLPTEYVDGLKRLYWEGTWASADADTRFTLTVTGDKAAWTERSPSGAKLTRTVPLKVVDPGARVERDNDAEVLTFLGFQPTLRSQILARRANPSYMMMRRVDRRIIAQWFGLSVTKNLDATLKDLRQPGSMPPKQYEFDRLP